MQFKVIVPGNRPEYDNSYMQDKILMPKTPDDSQSHLTGRIARYARVGGAATKLATRLAGQKFFGIDINRDAHAVELVTALGNLKGPLMKVGQILSTIPEALPPEYASAFQELQSNAPPMGSAFVKRRMNTELGPDWQNQFKSFDMIPAAAASLGQVHRAVLPDGCDIACKIQYPNMMSAVDADLRQLNFIFSLYQKYDSAIKTDLIHAELADRLREELDYTLEAKYMQLYGHMLSDVSGVHVPILVPELSTSRLLTATWVQGHKILNFKTASPNDRAAIAMNLFRAWYIPFYQYGVIHGDPHLGNYSVRDDLSINLMDFGCVRIFPAKFVGGVIDLYHALERNHRDLAVHAFETWGFSALSNDVIDTLLLWARFLYAPLLDNTVRPIGEITDGIYGRDTAEEVHQRLRTQGGVRVPREFVFIDRAALGLGSVFLHLKAEVNWHRVFNEMIDGFDLKSVEKTQKQILKKFNFKI